MIWFCLQNLCFLKLKLNLEGLQQSRTPPPLTQLGAPLILSDYGHGNLLSFMRFQIIKFLQLGVHRDESEHSAALQYKNFSVTFWSVLHAHLNGSFSWGGCVLLNEMVRRILCCRTEGTDKWNGRGLFEKSRCYSRVVLAEWLVSG